MLIQHVSRKIIGALDPLSSNTHTPWNRTIHTVIEVHGAVVSVKGLLCLESSRPRAIRGLASKSAGGANMRTTIGVVRTR